MCFGGRFGGEGDGRLPSPTMTPSPKFLVECTKAHKMCSLSGLIVQTIEGAKIHV